MSLFGSIFGGKRKHEEKMEKLKRDEENRHDRNMVDLALAQQGINPHNKAANDMAAAGNLVGGFSSIMSHGAAGGTAGGLGDIFSNFLGTKTTDKNNNPNIAHQPSNMIWVIIGGVVLFVILIFSGRGK